MRRLATTIQSLDHPEPLEGGAYDTEARRAPCHVEVSATGTPGGAKLGGDHHPAPAPPRDHDSVASRRLLPGVRLLRLVPGVVCRFDFDDYDTRSCTGVPRSTADCT